MLKKTNVGGKRPRSGAKPGDLFKPGELEDRAEHLRDLSPRQGMAVRLLARGTMTQAEVGKQLGISQTAISHMRDYPVFQKALEVEQNRLALDRTAVFVPMLPGAIRQYENALGQNKDPKLGVEVAKDVFDNIYGKVPVGAQSGQQVNLQINIISKDDRKPSEIIDADVKFIEAE